MNLGHLIGIGGAIVLAVGWTFVLLREFVVPWFGRKLNLTPKAPDTTVAPEAVKGVQITFGRRNTRRFRPTLRL